MQEVQEEVQEVFQGVDADDMQNVEGIPDWQKMATRAQLLAGGALVDVSPFARSFGFRFPLAVSAALWKDITTIPTGHPYQDADGRLADVLNMFRFAAKRRPDVTTFSYSLILHQDGDVNADLEEGEEPASAYRVRSVVGPGDHCEPVLTLTKPGEFIVQRFPLGSVSLTPGVMEAGYAWFDDARKTATAIADMLHRHVTGDWGTLDEGDKAANEEALNHNTRLLSAYTFPDATRVWIITEASRTQTTVLLPDEY